MSARTPGIQPRSQYHSYWGQYAYTVGAGVWANGSNVMPGAPGNVISAVEFAKLETGDIASSTDALTANRTLYVCVDTSGGNGLVEWSMLAMASVVQTIRDAHVIVVGQTGYLPAALPQSPDVVAVTCDFLDPGTGSGLQSALAAALASGIAVDIRLRPCALILTAATVGAGGFSVPALCRLLGAGQSLSSLTGANTVGVTQTVVTLGLRSTVEDCLISSPAPLAAPGGAQDGVVECVGLSAQVLRCFVTLERSVTFDRVATSAIRAIAPGDDFLVADCGLFVDSLYGQAAPGPSYGVLIGSSTSARLRRNPEVRNVVIDEASVGVGSASVAVFMQNVEGGRCFNVEHSNCRAPLGGAYIWVWDLTPGGPVTTAVRGPRFESCRVDILGDDSSSQTGFFVGIGASAVNLQGGLKEIVLDHCTVQYQDIINPNPGIVKEGFRIQNAAADTTEMSEIDLTACKVITSALFAGYSRGFVLDTTASTTAFIRSTRVTGCQARHARDGYGAPPNGLVLRANTGGGGVTNTGVQNCDFSGIQGGATSIALEVESVTVVDTIAVGNNLTPAGLGTALFDGGTGTEAAHNIL